MSKLFEKLQEHVLRQPDRTALWQRRLDGSYEPTSYAQLATSARHFAHAFRDRVPEGQIIPMCLAKTPACVSAMFGALGAYRAFACVNQKLRPPQVERILSDTQAAIALIDGAGLMALKGGMRPDSPIARIRWWLMRGAGFGPTHERLAEQLRTVARVEDWVDSTASAAPISVPGDDPKEVGCCLFTSGSTGTPKGVLISRSDLMARAEAEVLWFGLTKEDVLLSILPYSFDVGLNQLLSAVSVGCELVVLDSWLPKDILKAVEARQVTGISAVPSIWLDFLSNELKFDTQGAHASLRYITVSGGDMSRLHLDQLPSIAEGVSIFKTYGQTETFRTTSLKPQEYPAKRYSIGRPFHDARFYVVREDQTRAKPNETGEVVHTGLGTMLGYLGQDSQMKIRNNPFVGPDDESPWAIFTGDLGYVDEEGYLYLVGRRDDMIKITGYRVYPGEVREQLLSVKGVLQAEVVAVKTGEQTRLAAFVILAAGAPLTGPAIRVQLAARVPSYMVPELVVPKPALPRTASGKPDRQVLAAEALELLGGNK